MPSLIRPLRCRFAEKSNSSIRSSFEKQFTDGLEAPVRRVDKRTKAVVVRVTDVCFAADQKFDRCCVAIVCCPKQRRVASGVLLVDVCTECDVVLQLLDVTVSCRCDDTSLLVGLLRKQST